MNYIKILASGNYLPKINIKSEELENKLNLEKNYIYKRTGIKERYNSEEETIEEMAKNAVQDLFKKNVTKENIGLIIVATTTTNCLMPGISNYIQKEFEIAPCICLDILAGCSGYINAFDIASLYIQTGKIEKALIIGVDILSKYTNSTDIGTAIILSDGAGATLIERTKEEKLYVSNIEADGRNNEILTCKSNENIFMNGKEIYKYAVTNTIATRLNIDANKIYTNIKYTGNTFCASIPIALDEMIKGNLLKKGDKIILLGYGGGLNTGTILLEI